ncbi:MAG TPA: NAD(P)/FAD-dependent oxidoreductase, partial [Burkholderiaceae bacterium]|nr:NAD(P)/FAD-dependent oxidoreductase [Burkholderiaceae bacterium]
MNTGLSHPMPTGHTPTGHTPTGTTPTGTTPLHPAQPPACEDCDVFVIGGGPAGSTIAALLAEQGRRVVLAEKLQHPRFHIGESLLPANVALFDKLGLRAEVERIGMPKWGVEFVSPLHTHQSYVEFADAWDKSMPYAWQVRRSELDELLFRHAAARGAQAIEGCRVRDVHFEAGQALVETTSEDGAARHWRARFVVDASGRDTFFGNKLGVKRKNPRHNSSALFGHYTGARRLEGQREGNISIFWFAHGWFWFIPLADGTTSVGAVCWPYYLKSRTQPLQAFFDATIAACPALAERLHDAHLVDEAVHATGNYSYDSTQCAGDRYVMLGDAFAFIDPVFSSGVYLAMQNAF